MSHGVVGLLVGEQLGGHLEDGLLLGARDLHGTRLHGLGPLSLPAQDKHRPSQSGSLLLQAAGVGHHQIGPGHQVVHLLHVQGIDEMDAVVAGQVLGRRLPHHGRQVDRVHQLHVLKGLGHPAEGGHDVGHGLAVILPPVAGDQDDLLMFIVQLVEQFSCKVIILYNCCLESVNDGIAGDKHPVGDVLPGQVGHVGGSGTEMQVGNVAHQLAVHLLREWGVLVPGAQAGLHMTHLDLMVESGQSTGKGGGGVAMDQHQVGLGLLQHPLHAQQALGGDGGQGLPGLHNVQVILRLESENVQHRVQHLAVLRGNTADRGDVGPALKLLHQGGHLDGLRPGAENGHNTDLFHFFL